MARLKEKYTAEVAPALMKQFGYKSVMRDPQDRQGGRERGLR